MPDASAKRLSDLARGVFLLLAAAAWCLVSGVVVVAYYSGLLSSR